MNRIDTYSCGDVDGFMPCDNSAKTAEEFHKYPFCLLDIKNKESCYAQEASILITAIIALLFTYQLYFVWIRSYKYTICSDSRVMVLFSCAIYCLCLVIYFFVHLEVRTYLQIVLDIAHFWIAATTMMVYFKRIIAILPEESQQKWTGRLKCQYILVNLLVTAIALEVGIQIAIQNIDQALDCSLIDFIVFRTVKVLGFLSYGVVLCMLNNEVDEIECYSRIDRKIKSQYASTLHLLRFVLGF
jgi:hypothetical protein